MNVAEFSIKNRVFVNMVFIVLLVVGIAVYFGLPMELWPNVTLKEAVVVTSFPGASPLEVEKLVTNPLEDVITELDDIDYTESRSLEGLSIIHIVYDPKLGDIDEALIDLRSKVDEVRDLPEEADAPEVIKLNSDEFTPVMLVTLGGGLTAAELREVAEELKEELSDIEGVSSLEVRGVAPRQVWVMLDPDRLRYFGLSAREVVGALARWNLSAPGGSTHSGRDKVIVRTIGEYDDMGDIAATRVTSPRTGVSVPLSALATLRDTCETQTVITRLNGNPAATLAVAKKKRGSIASISKQVRERTEQFVSRLKVPVEVSFRQDTSLTVKDALGVMQKNAVLGAVLVGGLLFLFLGVRNAMLAIVGIPFTFLCAFLFMGVAGISINWISLFSLVLILGIVVDDAIFIIENVFRHVERGMPVAAATVKGTGEIAYPVLTSVLTTIAAFVPMMMMTGLLGRFLVVIPKTVVIALLASLLEALLILPVHIVDFIRPMGRAKRDLPVYRRMRRLYRRALFFALRRRYLVVAGVVVVAVLCGLLLKTVEVELFTEEDMDQIVVQAKTKPGTALEETDRVAAQLEKIVLSLPAAELQGEVTKTGMMVVNYRYWEDSHLIEIGVDLTRAKKRKRSDLDIIAELREKMSRVPGLIYLDVDRPEMGPPTGPPVEVRVVGEDYGRLLQLARMVGEKLASYPGVRDVRNNYEMGKNEARVFIDEERAALFGVSTAEVAATVKAAFDGIEATSFRPRGSEEVDVIVRLAGGIREDVGGLKKLWVPTPDGGSVPLLDVASIEVGRGISQIHHRDGKRAITVSANLLPGFTSSTVNEQLKQDLADFSQAHPGYRLEYGGEYEETQKSFQSLYRSITLAIFLIYAILVVQFQSFIQPLVVMFTVPFSFIGVVVGLVVMGMKFNIDALIAILALSGIVVNSGIVLVDFVNRARSRSWSRWRCIAWAGRERMRPIFLTTSTTVLGLLPMALGLGGSSETWGPMATSIVWGLLFASLLTLFVIPCLCAIVDDIRERAFSRGQRKR